MNPHPPAVTVPVWESNSNIVNRTPVIRGFDATYERIDSVDIGRWRRASATLPMANRDTLSQANYPRKEVAYGDPARATPLVNAG